MNDNEHGALGKRIGSGQSGPKFSGVTGTLQDRHWVSPETLQKLLNVSSTSYVGRLPVAFTSSMQESPKQVYQAFDELVHLLRGMRRLDDISFEFNIGNSKKPVTIQYVGSGAYGTVYKLTVNNQPFALKVYHEDNEVSSHGTFGESATGLYFSKKDLKDISKFYFGNPKAGWGVFEFVTKDMSPDKRKGQSIKDFPVSLGDDHGANSINGIRVDYGGISKGSKTVKIRNFDDYKKAIASNDTSVQASAASQIYDLPSEFIKEAVRIYAQAIERNRSFRYVKDLKVSTPPR